MSKPVPKVRPRSVAEIERIADGILRKHSPETLAGLTPFPVLDFIDGPLLDEYGVDFDVQDLGPSVEGRLEGQTLTLNTEVYKGLIHDQSRARFTGAHETGHAVLHAGQLAVMNDSSRGRPTLYRKEEIKPFLNPEWQANIFAGAVLMPLSGVLALLRENWLGSSFAVKRIAARFKVSDQAAEIRLKRLIERGDVEL